MSDGELVIARSELDALHDDLYVLERAVTDTRRSLEHDMTNAELLTALRWLLDAASPLTDRRRRAPSDVDR